MDAGHCPIAQLRAFAFMWCAARTWELATGAGHVTAINWFGLAMVTSAGVAVVTGRRAPLSVALVLSIVRTLQRIPMSWDNEYWDLQTDAALLWNMADLGKAAATLRAQYTCFYAAAGFWKLNRAFLDPTASCATVFFLQHVGQWLPADVALAVAPTAAAIAPAATVMVELAVGIAMGLAPRLGAALALVLHSGIAATPKPNNIASFSAKCAARLIFFASPDAVYALVNRLAWPIVVALPVYLAFVKEVLQPQAPQDWACAVFAPACIFVSAALLLSRPVRAPASKGFTALALYYSFVPLVLGTADLGMPSMYSNLRLTGGTNHLLFPTGLLHSWRKDDPASIFYGGTVRVETTTSSSIRQIYPNDITNDLTPDNAVQLLDAAGYQPARFFHPAKPRVLGRHTVPDVPRDWTRFSCPAFELRRLIAEAKAAGEPFEIVYSRLPGDIGDEDWRANAASATITAVFAADGALLNCTDTLMSQPCHDLELARLAPLPYFATKAMLFLPYPIVTRGNRPPPNVLCFGP